MITTTTPIKTPTISFSGARQIYPKAHMENINIQY